MVLFKTLHYRHCSWPVRLQVCVCANVYYYQKPVLILLFEHFLWANSCNQLAFLCVFGWSGFCPWCEILLCWCLMVDRPVLVNCKALSLLRTVNEQRVKYWHVFSWYLIDIRWIDDKKITFETCFTCMKRANFYL